LDAPIEYCRKVNANSFVYQPGLEGINRKKCVWTYFFIAILWQEDLIINSVPEKWMGPKQMYSITQTAAN